MTGRDQPPHSAGMIDADNTRHKSAQAVLEADNGWARLGRVGLQRSGGVVDLGARRFGYRRLFDPIPAQLAEDRSEGNARFIGRTKRRAG